jgi:hypothetical protein
MMKKISMKQSLLQFFYLVMEAVKPSIVSDSTPTTPAPTPASTTSITMAPPSPSVMSPLSLNSFSRSLHSLTSPTALSPTLTKRHPDHHSKQQPANKDTNNNNNNENITTTVTTAPKPKKRGRSTSVDLFTCIEHFHRRSSIASCVPSTSPSSSASSHSPDSENNSNLSTISEDLASHIFVQIVDVVSHLHQLGFVHRDLKDENVLIVSNSDFDTQTPGISSNTNPTIATDTTSNENDQNFSIHPLSYQIKLIDFGSARSIPRNPAEYFEGLSGFKGTWSYISPEVWKNEKWDGVLQDVWSLGVVLYVILEGELPFEVPDLESGSLQSGKMWDGDLRFGVQGGSCVGNDNVGKNVIGNAVGGGVGKGSQSRDGKMMCWWEKKLELSHERSKECVDLLERLLERDVSKRITVDEILRHPWVVRNGKR